MVIYAASALDPLLSGDTHAPETAPQNNGDDHLPLTGLPTLTTEQLFALTKDKPLANYRHEELVREQLNGQENKGPTVQDYTNAVWKTPYEKLEAEAPNGYLEGVPGNNKAFGTRTSEFGLSPADPLSASFDPANPTNATSQQAKIKQLKGQMPETIIASNAANVGELLNQKGASPDQSPQEIAQTLANMSQRGNTPIAGIVLPDAMDFAALRKSISGMQNVGVEDLGHMSPAAMTAEMHAMTPQVQREKQQRNDEFAAMIARAQQA